ncbi:ferredoxin family protein [Methanopyrus sp. KOL6]|uniref:4Fe-4S dicluster domain-containing protein n=1 Tax=Methanopyrus sp. KOL6 TaxID=1937004 RepID=UPI000B4B1157|nr:ferredoxin family protein [Methanopyrus sp. KOL6]
MGGSGGEGDGRGVGKTSYEVVIREEHCKGCFLCSWVCPIDALDRSNRRNKRGYLLPEWSGECTGCRQCELICPDLAIEVREVEGDE